MRMFHFILCFIIPFLFGLTLCSKDYNPFSDPENCDIHFISQSFDSSHSLNIFSTETVTVLITAPSFVQSLTIEAKKNRYFGNKDSITLPSVSGLDTILFSFYDTGTVRINFHLKKTTGENVYKEINCYVRAPLKGSTVSGGFDSLHQQTFKTGSVSDKDVIYEWKFFDKTQPGPISLFSAETTGLFIDKVNESGYGTVKITDKINSFLVDTFTYSFDDIYPPQLIFLDDWPQHGDTLFCSGESFYKKIQVTDRGCGIIQDVRINGHSEVEKEEIIKSFSSSLEVIEIFLRDASKKQNSVTLKYYVKNVSGRVAPDANLKFKILPDEDTLKVSTPFFKGFTYVEYYDKRTLNHQLNVFVNDHMVDSTKLTHVQYSYDPLNANLVKGWNTVMVELVDKERGRPVDTIVVPVNYDLEYKVDKNPTIFDIRFVNARVSRGQVVLNSDSLEVMVVAYDDKGKVRNVVVNKDTLVCNNNENQWSGTIPIFSKTTVTPIDSIKITAIDSAGQKAESTFDIIKNTRPSLKAKKRQVQIIAGTVYLDTLMAADADGDKLTHSVVDSAGKSIKINAATGEIRWNTALSDVNRTGYLFYFSVTDNYDVLVDSMRVIVIKDSSDAILPVHFTKPSNIPSDMEVGLLYAYKLRFDTRPDSVCYNLKTDMNSIKIKNDTLLLNPQPGDTGYHRVTLVATNLMNESDSLYFDFNVNKTNSKPVIKADSSVYKGGIPGITVAGSIDSFMIFTLWIDDPDNIDKKVLKTGVKSQFSNAKIELLPGIDNKYKLLLFNSNNMQGEDTLLVYCEDHGGLVDTLKIPVHYSLKVSPVKLLSPAEGEYVQSDTVLFRWNRCNGAEIINYLVQTGLSQDTGVQTVIVKDTSFAMVVRKSDTYRWRVITASGRDTAYGQWQYFTLHSPTHIQFDMVAEKIKSFCFADVDTYLLKLEIKAGTGSMSKEFKASLIRNKQEKTVQVTNNGVLTWIPTVNDTGIYELNIRVKDDIGNADTLQTKLSVVPASGCHISIRCSDTALYCDNAVDLYGVNSKTNLIVTVDRSRRSVFDTFNISVTSNGYAVNVDADSAVMVLQRPFRDIADDTLAIVAHNKSTNLASGTEKVIVRYNVPAKKVTIGSGTMALNEGLSKIPVLIRLDKNNVGFTKKCGFRFLANGKKDTLRYQINSWNQSSKTAEVWVLFDSIVSSGNTMCIMEYGYQLPDNSNGKLVFDTLNNFSAVYHFEGLNDKALIVKDQSEAANGGAFTSTNYDIIPAIGSGVYFKNATNQINLQKKIVIGTTTQKTVVFESWVRMISGNITATLFDIKISPILQCSFVSAAGVLKCKYTYDELGNGDFRLGIGTKNVLLPVLNEWARVALLLNVQRDNVSYAIFINGAKLAEEPLSSLPQSVIDNLSWTDGTSILCSNAGSINYDGQYDEVWISKIRRSDDWYKFSYENQKETSSLIKIEDVDYSGN